MVFVFTLFGAVRLLERVDKVIHKEDHHKYLEAIRIAETFDKESKKLVSETGARVQAELRSQQQEKLTHIANLQRLGGHRFEELMTRLFLKMGYKALQTPGSGDEGVDIIAELKGKRIVIQCKNYIHPVGPSPVRDLCGVKHSRKADRAILVCTSTFTEAAERFAKHNGVELVDGREVIEMIKEYDLTS